jgi:hypothetical protein
MNLKTLPVFIGAWSSSNDIRFQIHGILDYKLIRSLHVVTMIEIYR